MAERKNPNIAAVESQRNVAPPDVVRNVVKFDGALWKGKNLTSFVQRCGIAVLGSFFLLSGCFYVALTLGILDESSGQRWNIGFVYTIMSVTVVAGLGLLIGGRLFFNLFRGSRKAEAEHMRRSRRHRG
jgi:hypothetical protein